MPFLAMMASSSWTQVVLPWYIITGHQVRSIGSVDETFSQLSAISYQSSRLFVSFQHSTSVIVASDALQVCSG